MTRADGWPATGARSIAAHTRAMTAALTAAQPRRIVTLPLSSAAGRVLAADVTATGDLPGFDNSQMDGFAVRAADTRAADAPVTLPLTDVIPAGHWPDPLPAGHAAPIMTGAPIPPGADAVIPIEDTDAADFDAAVRTGQVTVPEAVAGRFVRPAGSDARAGAVLLTAGTRLTVPALGTIAALGQTDVRVRARPRALVLTGGDEVVAPGTHPLPPGALYDANLTMLTSWLECHGVEVAAARLISDSVAEVTAGLERDIAAHAPELIVTSGGISAGRFEVIRQALSGSATAAGADFGSVTMQPGGPQGLGTHASGAVIISFPGNPVSTWVSAEMFLRPALAAAYRCTPAPRWRPAALAADVRPLPAREQIRRGTWRTDAAGHLRALPFPGTSSHLLAGAAQATALIRIPAGDEVVAAGSTVEILTIEEASHD